MGCTEPPCLRASGALTNLICNRWKGRYVESDPIGLAGASTPTHTSAATRSRSSIRMALIAGAVQPVGLDKSLRGEVR